MQLTRDGPVDGPNVVLILGWGNKHDHENVTWLRERLADDGYRVHAFQIPEVIGDFETEYLGPVEDLVADLESFRLVTHSTGGLIGAFVDGGITRTHLSPWWGFPRGPAGLDDSLLSLLARIPTRRPLVPSGQSSREDLGALATDRQLSEGPTRAAPSFLREVRRAQDTRPDIDEDTVVFCSPRDGVVSVRAIVEAVSFDQLVFYDGGHEWFSSPSRDELLDTFLAAVDGGLDAVTDQRT